MPFTHAFTGSNPVQVTIFNGGLAQLGEHLPYKQRVIGSSPIGPISSENGFKCYADVTQFMTIEE